jgi:hypothetical protein
MQRYAEEADFTSSRGSVLLCYEGHIFKRKHSAGDVEYYSCRRCGKYHLHVSTNRGVRRTAQGTLIRPLVNDSPTGEPHLCPAPLEHEYALEKFNHDWKRIAATPSSSRLGSLKDQYDALRDAVAAPHRQWMPVYESIRRAGEKRAAALEPTAPTTLEALANASIPDAFAMCGDQPFLLFFVTITDSDGTVRLFFSPGCFAC